MSKQAEAALNENSVDLLDVESGFEEELVLNSAEYCAAHCVFYKTCFANHGVCLRSAFRKIFENLTARERNVLKDLCGYGKAPMSVEEIGEKYGRSPEKMEQIIARTFRKLRRPSVYAKCRHFLFDAFSASDEPFYAGVLAGIFGFTAEDFIEIRLGFDFDVINEQTMKKDPEEIKAQLTERVEDLLPLSPYLNNFRLLNITGLNHLLHTPQSLLFQRGFKGDDRTYFEMVRCLEQMGYQFKDSYLKGNIKGQIEAKLLSRLADEALLTQTISGLPIALFCKLTTQGIGTYNDLLNRMKQLKQTLTQEEIAQLEQFLKEAHLTYSISSTEVEYLSKEKMEIFVGQFVEWMAEKRNSITELIRRFDAMSAAPHENLAYLCEEYWDFFDLSQEQPEYDKETLISELDLNVRAYNTLKRAGIQTIGELNFLSEEKLRSLPACNDRVVRDIKNKMAEMGISLTEDKKRARFSEEFSPKRRRERIVVLLQNRQMLREITVESICGIHRNEQKKEISFLCMEGDALFEYRYYADRMNGGYYHDTAMNRRLLGSIWEEELTNFCDAITKGEQWDHLRFNESVFSVKRPYLSAFLQSTESYLVQGLRLFLQNDMGALAQLSDHAAKRFF